MYQRCILCTLYGAVDFLNVLKKGCWGGGVVEVHSEIHYLPLGEGWEEVVVRNVLQYLPIAAIAAMVGSTAARSHQDSWASPAKKIRPVPRRLFFTALQ